MEKINLYQRLTKAVHDLPGEKAHLEMFPKRKGASEVAKSEIDYRKSAVLALLYQDEGLKMILTQRNDYKGVHSGQISFPGGKMEDFDENTLSTALRESNEEIGVEAEKIKVLGKLTELYIPVSRFLVHPYLAFHEGVPVFNPSEREVKKVITFDLQLLLEERTLQRRTIKTANGMNLKDIPCFIIEENIVWGATALILNEIRQMLLL
jgi:8-oxo-dGTP pyrophosphatase MutT (NUDIX family)